MAENKAPRSAVPSDIPNLFLATTYALNKSISKRVTIGLEHQGSYFVPVIKFGGSNSFQVTFDTSSWELFLQNVDMMTAYFKEPLRFAQAYGSPPKIYLPSHDIEFTTSYGGKSIVLINRPIVTPNNVITITQAQEKNGENGEENEPANKKKKMNHPPSIVMQSSTFDGLKELQQCITNKLRYLVDIAGFVNRVFGVATAYIEKALVTEGKKSDNDERIDVKKTVSDFTAFKTYCFLNRDFILEHIEMTLSMGGLRNSVFEPLACEMFAFGLTIIAYELNKSMFPKSLE